MAEVFRPHRSTFAESMADAVEIEYPGDLPYIVRDVLGVVVEAEDMEIRPYGWEPRLGKEIRIVKACRLGVLGFIHAD